MTYRPTILYDAQIFDIQNYGGISRYFSNLITGVKQSGSFEVKLPIVHSTNYYIRAFPRVLNYQIGNILCKNVKTKSRWNNWYVQQNIKRNDFDIFHPTYYNPYFLESLTKPLVITVHDMIYENFPHLFGDAPETIQQKKILLDASTLIIAISEFTKKEITAHYPYLSPKIKVIYHGLPKVKTSITKKMILPPDFLLYVGDRNAIYKNFKILVEAVVPFMKLKKNLFLICAGGGPFTKEESEIFKSYGIVDLTMQVSASDSLMEQLYREAKLFLYPSLEEGFGLPILEAFANGCPIACSNTSCLPEIGGKAVTYFDPTDIDSMRQNITRIIDDVDLQVKQRNDGFEELKKFTFENCVQQTIDCYHKLTT